MQLDAKASALNARLTTRSAPQALRLALDADELGEIALVTSFGAESAVLLHLVAVTDPSLLVLFIDTGKHFAETLVYGQELVERLGLRNVSHIKALPDDLQARDPYGALHTFDSDACCALRKTEPLEDALAARPQLGALITGRKRYQGGPRSTLPVFEADAKSGLIKINPLAHFMPADVRTYMEENRLPRHPLLAKGYLSIGCAPCTSPVAAGEDPRAGRWRGSAKTECGIHFIGGAPVRNTTEKETT